MAQTSHGNADGDAGKPAGRDRPIGELVKELSEQTATLVRQEMELARAELTAKGKQAGAGAGMLAVAGTLAWFMLAALTAAGIIALAEELEGWEAWQAALAVAGAYGLLAGLLALLARSRMRKAAPPVPEETVESMKEDVEWAKDRAKAGRR